jgi:hypothetical protein
MKLSELQRITDLLRKLHLNYMALQALRDDEEFAVMCGRPGARAFIPIYESVRAKIIVAMEADLECGLEHLSKMGITLEKHDLRSVVFDMPSCTPPDGPTEHKPA